MPLLVVWCGLQWRAEYAQATFTRMWCGIKDSGLVAVAHAGPGEQAAAAAPGCPRAAAATDRRLERARVNREAFRSASTHTS
jgi:hypothetical protein